MNSTLTWLIGLFAVLTAGLFGLFVYRHAEASALSNAYNELNYSTLKALRTEAAVLAETPAKLDEQLRIKREKDAALDALEKTYLDDIDRLVRSNRVRLSENDELFKRELKTYNELMKEAPERRAELAREEERMYAAEHDFDESRRKLRDEVEKSSAALEALRKKGRSEVLVNDRRIAELEQRKAFLTRQIASSNKDMKSDGAILDARSAADGFVVIDRGSRHRLKKHTQFDVWTVRGGKAVVKGRVEVVNVEPSISVCRVLIERDGNDPFIDGDQLHNPVYDPAKITSFAVRGDFKRFSAQELRRFIEESGSRVDAELSVNTDYLVAGTAAQADIDQAVRLGVAILSEEQMLDFVQPDPSHRQVEAFSAIAERARAGAVIALAGTFAPVSASDIEDHLERLGARVVRNPDEAAVVVAGDDALPAITRARERGVPVFDQAIFRHIRDAAPAAAPAR